MSESLPSSLLRLPPPADPPARATLGVEGLDAALGGGLACGRLHELYALGADDGPCTQGFALMLALAARPGGHIVWLAEKGGVGRLYPPGVAELGVDPGRLLFVTVKDEAMLLKAAADIARAPAAGTLVVAPSTAPRKLDLTATRRLTLFAERSGVTVLLLRGSGEQPPSAAETRWLVSALPSTPLEADAPGGATFRVDLVRRRGGPPSIGWRLEWDRDALRFAGAAIPGAVPAEPGVGRLAG